MSTLPSPTTTPDPAERRLPTPTRDGPAFFKAAAIVS